jgi:hypothetical protein
MIIGQSFSAPNYANKTRRMGFQQDKTNTATNAGDSWGEFVKFAEKLNKETMARNAAGPPDTGDMIVDVIERGVNAVKKALRGKK